MRKTSFIPSLLFFIFFVNSVSATVYTVTNTSDNGSGSLREAISNVVINPGSHNVAFNIPTSDPNYNSSIGVWKITLSSQLLQIYNKSNITIDGTTQTTNQGDKNPLGPEIMLDGNSVVDYGFYVMNSSNITIKGFIIGNFIYGIQIFGPNSKNNIVSGNYLGTNYAANDSVGNFIGVEVFGGANHNTIGGLNVEDRNITSGNGHIGIRIFDASYNTVINNYVGTDRTGNLPLGNYDGISIEGSSKHNVIGSTNPAGRNLVSGNYAYGIPIFGAGCDSNIFIGNYMGTNAAGTAGIPNTYGFLFDDGAKYNIVGGYTDAERNIISGNSGYGAFLYNLGTSDNSVIGNHIGTDPTGTFAVPNGNGMVIDGAARNHLIDKNVISGNLQQGIAIHITGTDGHIIIRNNIGTDKTGNAWLSNGEDGIRIAEGPKNNLIGGSVANANIIACNLNNGVNIMTDNTYNNKISCNSIHQNINKGILLQTPLANMGIKSPVITNINNNQATQTLIVNGTIDNINPQSIVIEVFKGDFGLSTFCQGKTYISSVMPNSLGEWTDTIENFTGFAFIVATATDATGNTSEFSNSTPSEIAVFDKNDDLLLYPNPANNQLNLILPKSFQCANIQIFNSKGKMIIERSISSMDKTLDISSLSSGVYYLSASNEGKTINYKFIKNR
jgi:parallel beta-helix repeat protein